MRSGLPFSLPAAALLIAAAAGIGSAQYVEDSIDVGGTGVSALAYNSRADVVYARHRGASTFCAISCSLNQVVAQLALPSPSLICYNSTDNKAYVTSWGDSVLVIDGSTHARRRGIPLRWTDYPLWDSAGDRLYVTLADDNEVAVIDCRTDSVTALIRVGAWPNRLHLNTLHRKLYVQNYDDCSVSIVDLTTNQVIRTIPLGYEPMSGYYCEWAQKYYCSRVAQVVVIDGVGDTVLHRVDTPGSSCAWSMGANPELGLLFAGLEDGMSYHCLWAIDASADTVVAETPVNRGPQALFWSPTSGLLYCANYDGRVTVVSGDGARVRDTLPVAFSPFAFAYSGAQRRLYVGHLNSQRVYVIADRLGIGESGDPDAPPRARLRAEPSPFISSVTIRSDIAAGEGGRVSVYALDGTRVRTLETRSDGRAVWNGRDDHNREVAAGIYFLTLEQNGDKLGRKVVMAE